MIPSLIKYHSHHHILPSLPVVLGFMPLMVRVSEYYRDKPAGKICNELYDLFFREEAIGNTDSYRL